MKAGENKKLISTLGLLLITVWAAIQYVFLSNVPDEVSSFAFLFLTNIIGVVVLMAFSIPKLKALTKRTVFKGIGISLISNIYNFFIIAGSRHMDSVAISSLLSMYFVFVPIILVLMRKKVSFRSAIGAIIATIALILMFQADASSFFGSRNVIFLLIADLFFAIYVIIISIAGENEDASLLSITQMSSSAILAFICWGIEAGMGKAVFAFPKEISFWVAALFMGVLIRALYSVIQISCQKYVSPVSASLIFSSEIVITLLLNPLMSKLLGTSYTPATVYQIIGCVFFVIAVLVNDDTFMSRFGYSDMDEATLDPLGEADDAASGRKRTTMSRKLINLTLIISIGALVISMIVSLFAIHGIRTTTIKDSTNLGQEAALTSQTALRSEIEESMLATAQDKASLAEAKIRTYAVSTDYCAKIAEKIIQNPERYNPREVLPPQSVNKDKLALQRALRDEKVDYETVRDQINLMGNVEDIFAQVMTSNENINTIYMGTEEGYQLAYDSFSGEAEFPDAENYYDYTDSGWYNLAKTSEGPVFTEAYQDGYGRGLNITCVSAIHDASGKFYGAVAMDILMSDMNASLVSEGIINPSIATLIDKDGYIIASKDVDPASTDELNIADPELNHILYPVADEIVASDEGITNTGDKDGDLYVAFSSIDLTGWKMCITNPVSVAKKPADEIKQNIEENTDKTVASVGEAIRSVIQNCLIMFVLVLIFITIFVGRFAKKITDPIKKLEGDVNEISKGKLDQRTNVDTDDEVGNLARAFNYMTDSLQKYITDLKDATAREERIASELNVATKIQADMLPNHFPAFPDRSEFDLFATMTPAKEVGGDFYDFFQVDENHLGLVMADVSGKGVPAALFMVIAKTLIKNRCQLGSGNPSEILADVNNQLCENNEEGLFVTVWLGILDITTGKMTCSNAGHEFPAFRMPNGDFELIHDKHGMVLAGMEGSRYRDYEIEFPKGAQLFLYTDGVAEATSIHQELFGTDRMLEALNKYKDGTMEELLAGVRSDIDTFVEGADQFDDITMMTFRYFG